MVLLLSEFWFKVIMYAFIGHLVIFFIWIAIKLSPRKKDKKDEMDKNKKDTSI